DRLPVVPGQFVERLAARRRRASLALTRRAGLRSDGRRHSQRRQWLGPGRLQEGRGAGPADRPAAVRPGQLRVCQRLGEAGESQSVHRRRDHPNARVSALAWLGRRADRGRLAGSAGHLGELRAGVRPVRLVLSLADRDQHRLDPSRGHDGEPTTRITRADTNWQTRDIMKPYNTPDQPKRGVWIMEQADHHKGMRKAKISLARPLAWSLAALPLALTVAALAVNWSAGEQW